MCVSFGACEDLGFEVLMYLITCDVFNYRIFLCFQFSFQCLLLIKIGRSSTCVSVSESYL